MSETKLATKADLKEMYDRMLPYLGGSADAGFTPVGTIIALMSNHAPANYLICDGTVYNIADYPELANHFLNEFGSKNKFGGDGTTTFGIPDLRGEFLRGTGTNSHTGNGNGAAVGTHQDSTRLGTLYKNGTTLEYFPTDSGGHSNYANADSLRDRDTTAKWEYREGISLTQENVNAITIRPTNTSVLFCIATKNIYLNPSLDYSTDEKVVGTWIDGSTIYQRTFTGVTPSTSRTNIELTTEGNYKAVIDYNGYIETNYGNANIKFWDTVNNKSYGCTGAKVLDSTHQIVFSVIDADANSYVNKNFFITVQYIKTTS